MDLKDSKTYENLKNAFTKASQQNRLYLYFAQIANKEGRFEVFGLYKDTADGKAGHADGNLSYIETVGDPLTNLPIGDTEKNLKSTISEETKNYTDLYPNFAKIAKEEGFDDIAEWFEKVAKKTEAHAENFQKALDLLHF